jgi:hypothetical protein
MYMKLIYTFEIISHSKYGEHISLLILTWMHCHDHMVIYEDVAFANC